MELTDKQISEFAESWRRDFDETLTPEIARAEAMRLLDFFAKLIDALESPRPSGPSSASNAHQP